MIVLDKTTATIYLSTFRKAPCCTFDKVVILVSLRLRAKFLVNVVPLEKRTI